VNTEPQSSREPAMWTADRWLTSDCMRAALEKRPRGVGIQVLGNPWIDRTLARAHPAFPAAFYGPWIVLVLWLGYRPGDALRFTAAFLVGWLVWSLVEYAVHRFVFHRSFAATRSGRIAAFLTHGYHHAYPRDPTRLVMPPLMSVPLAAALFVLAHLVLGGGALDAVFCGFVAGYVAYDSVHYVVHHTRATTGVLGWLRRYHLMHHHRDPPARYGVSSPLWDVVLGTFRGAPSSPR
jgi:dihydroceramide fatty acyl 2-hydroxylase